MEQSKHRPIKVTVVGDGTVGKTCLLMCYVYKVFPTLHVPTVFDTFDKGVVPPIELDGVTYELHLWDTAGQEDYDRLRPLSYPNTDVFLVCYAVDNRASYGNIEKKWIPELKRNCPNVPVVLVATKDDKRPRDQTISDTEGKKLCEKIKAAKFIECSALTGHNLKKVFEDAVVAALEDPPLKRCCVLM